MLMKAFWEILLKIIGLWILFDFVVKRSRFFSALSYSQNTIDARNFIIIILSLFSTIVVYFLLIAGGSILTFDTRVIDMNTFIATYQFTQVNINSRFSSNHALVISISFSGETILDLSHSSSVVLLAKNDITKSELPEKQVFKFSKELLYVDKNNDRVSNLEDVINYTFWITNTGNLTIHNIVITDFKPKGVLLVSLVPLEFDAMICKPAYKIVKEDMAIGAFSNLTMAEGTDLKGNRISRESKEPILIILIHPPYKLFCEIFTVAPLEQKSKIYLVKTTSSNDLNNKGNVKEGETITYNFIGTKYRKFEFSTHSN